MTVRPLRDTRALQVSPEVLAHLAAGEVLHIDMLCAAIREADGGPRYSGIFGCYAGA